MLIVRNTLPVSNDTSDKLKLFVNALLSIMTTFFGNVILAILVEAKDLTPIYESFESSSNVTEVSEIQFSNAPCCPPIIDCTFLGIVTSTSKLSVLNAPAGIVVRPLPILSDCKSKLYANADFPKTVTPSGIDKEIKLALKNALSLIV